IVFLQPVASPALSSISRSFASVLPFSSGHFLDPFSRIGKRKPGLISDILFSPHSFRYAQKGSIFIINILLLQRLLQYKKNTPRTHPQILTRKMFAADTAAPADSQIMESVLNWDESEARRKCCQQVEQGQPCRRRAWRYLWKN